jgi:hypothetical protein
MRIIRIVLALIASALFAPSAYATLLGPLPYTNPADSPFFPFTGYTYFHLETFDDHALNTPGVIPSAGDTAANQGFSGSIIDQVGLPGGCPPGGLAVPCDTWFAPIGSAGVRFTFDADVLGHLPTVAGLVWTDGAGTIRFEAFDQDGVSLGVVFGDHADASILGTIEDDRFYGAIHPAGVSALFISNTSGGIEIDDLQYGFRASPAVVSQPGTLILLSLALVALAGRRWRSE